MYGYTPDIERFLSSKISVNYVVEHRNHRPHIFERAIQHFEPDNITTNFSFTIGGARFALYGHAPFPDRLTESFRGFRGVILFHPDILFEHGEDEELLDLVKHINARHIENGSPKPRPT